MPEPVPAADVPDPGRLLLGYDAAVAAPSR
jgi:hypothetical protein